MIPRYYLKPMVKYWRTTLRMIRSAAKGDWSEWSEITVDDLLHRLQSDRPPLLIDVRSPGEFNGGYGHIPDSKSIPVLELQDHLEELEPYRDELIVTMCPGGGMSLVAVEILEKEGFNEVKSLKGGTDLWHEKGYPLTLN